MVSSDKPDPDKEMDADTDTTHGSGTEDVSETDSSIDTSDDGHETVGIRPADDDVIEDAVEVEVVDVDEPQDVIGPDAVRDDVVHDGAVHDDSAVDDLAGDVVADTVADTADDVPEVERIETSSVEPLPVVVPPKGNSGFLGGLIGGLIAAALAFAALFILFPDLLKGDDTALIERIDAQNAKIEGLEADLAASATALETAQSDVTTAQDGVATAQDGVATAQGLAEQVQSELAALTARFDTISEVELGELPKDVQDRIASQRAELAALQEEMSQMSTLAQDQIASAEAQQEAAAIAAANAAARGALNDVRNALATGGGFANALPVIAEATDVPEPLEAVAGEGAATLQALQKQFKDTARAALLASNRAGSGDDTSSRFSRLFQESFMARSLEPREGDDPDAVLSRTEAALLSGDLAGALGLIGQLPEDGQTVLTDWTADAQARFDATQALDALTAALSAD